MQFKDKFRLNNFKYYYANVTVSNLKMLLIVIY